MAAVNTVQTFLGGVDFPFIELQEGQYLAYYSAHGNIGYASSPSAGYLAIMGQPDPTGTPQTWTGSPQFTFALSATVLAFAKTLNVADGASLVSGGRTLLDRQTFSAPYIPPSWTQTGGWTIASGGGLLSPASSPSYSKPAYSNAWINAERRTYIIAFELVAAASIFAVYSALIDPMDGTFGSQIVFDASANTLAINHAITAPALTSGLAISTPLGFVPAIGTRYTITIQMDRRVMTVSVSDPITGITAQLVSGSNDATNVDEPHGGPAGLMFDSLGFQCAAGQIKVDAYSIYADAKYPRALIWGDSITHGSGVRVWERWAQLAANQIGNTVISAHGGCSSNNCLAKIPTELQTLRPEYLVMMIGSNDAFPGNLGLATWQANVSTIIAAAVAQGTKVVLCTLPPRYDIAQSTINAFNAWLFSLTGVTLVRMDRALTVANDGVTQNTALYIDGVHPNPTGSLAMAARFAVDAPALLDASVIAAQATPLNAVLMIDGGTKLPVWLSVYNGVPIVTPV
jgi:lysophospholipase L1-like esterase